ncbi:MAG TPA: V-type ATP synthase subunit E family protein [Candidatus Bathyarchaeia archaeon]|nr:V-type ATP synthase subunit E family protein [Candidatus Bathyarchaeia archaeon]
MSTEKLRINQMIDDIISNAKEEANIILNDAKKQAKEIQQKGKDLADKEKQIILESRVKTIKEQEKQQIASLNLQARREILLKKEAEITKTFDLAKNELTNFNKKAEYDKILVSLIIEAGIAVDGGNLTVFLRKEDQNKIKDFTPIAKEVTKKTGNKCSLQLSKNTINTIGGVVLKTDDGSISINNTFEALLEQKYRIIRTNVANTLSNQ